MSNSRVYARKFSITRLVTDEPLFVHELDAMHSPAARVLDIGAGHGTFNYSNFSATTIGIDNESRLQLSLSQKGRFIRCDAAALPLGSDLFDAVVANFVFEHFSSPQAVLSEIQRVLKPDGLLYVAIPNSASLEDRLFRLLGGHRYHSQRYSFSSFVRLVYETTTLKLMSFADWPAGFTWLNLKPSGKILRRAILYCLIFYKRYLIDYAGKDSGLVFLFKKCGRSGYRNVTDVCSRCGSGATINQADIYEWECDQCGYKNQVRRARTLPVEVT